MAQSNNSHYFMATPQDFLSTPYGYSGQMSPETAVAEQALNRRRYLANLLVQQGLQQAGQAPSGQMVGRFYVGSSPLQGFANLAQAGVGLGMGLHQMNKIDTQQSELMKADRQSVVDAIQAYQDKIKQKQQLAAAPVGVPTTPPSSPPPGPAAGSPEAAIPQPEAFRGIAPAQPPDEHTGVSDFRARPDTLPFGQNPSGVSQTITPGDMSQFANSANPAMAQEQLGTQAPPSAAPPAPVPTPQPTPGQSYRPTMNDLADLITHQHPTVQAYGRLLAQQMMQEQEHQRNQGNLDRTYALDEKKLAANLDATRAMREDTNAYRMASLGQQGDLTRATQAIAQQRADTDAAQAAASAQANKIAASLNQSKLAEDIRHNKATESLANQKFTNPAMRPMSATAQKELIQTEEELQGSHQAIENLRSALAINDKALGFTGASSLASAASVLPDGIRPSSVDATVDLDNLVTGSALPQLKAIFGGNPTEGERKVLLEIQGASSKTPPQRKAIFERAIIAAQNRLKFGMQKAEQLRSGKYFSGEGGIDTSAMPNPGMAPITSPQTQASTPARSVTRTGMHNGKKVIQYSDGSIEYAP